MQPCQKPRETRHRKDISQLQTRISLPQPGAVEFHHLVIEQDGLPREAHQAHAEFRRDGLKQRVDLPIEEIRRRHHKRQQRQRRPESQTATDSHADKNKPRHPYDDGDENQIIQLHEVADERKKEAKPQHGHSNPATGHRIIPWRNGIQLPKEHVGGKQDDGRRQRVFRPPPFTRKAFKREPEQRKSRHDREDQLPEFPRGQTDAQGSAIVPRSRRRSRSHPSMSADDCQYVHAAPQDGKQITRTRSEPSGTKCSEARAFFHHGIRTRPALGPPALPAGPSHRPGTRVNDLTRTARTACGEFGQRLDQPPADKASDTGPAEKRFTYQGIASASPSRRRCVGS